MKKLSIVIPVFNEKNTIKEIIRRVENSRLENIEKEIIIVDDYSLDGTREILQGFSARHKIIFQNKNMGKGAALRSGFGAVTGDIIIVQDADLEYDPSDYGILVEPIISGQADVVYGSRLTGSKAHRVLFFWHYLGNKFLTSLSNIMTNLNLTDMETCYKALTRDALNQILPRLTSNRFGIEPEMTAYFAKCNFRIFEVGISYFGRNYNQGKKINWRDGLAAIWHIIKFNLFSGF